MLFYDKFIIFAFVRKYDVEIYGKLEEMPHLLEGDFFHSLELFQILEKTPGITPFMAVATQENKVVGQMLVILYHRKSLFPPYLYTHAHAYGEGLYAPEAQKNAFFPFLRPSKTIH